MKKELTFFLAQRRRGLRGWDGGKLPGRVWAGLGSGDWGERWRWMGTQGLAGVENIQKPRLGVEGRGQGAST